MLDKQQILSSIKALAKQLGRVPTRAEFVSHSGISFHTVMRWFRTWNGAVRAARLRPHKPRLKLKDHELLEDWGRATRKNQRLLSRRAYPLVGKYDPGVMSKRFGSWSGLPEAFRKFATGKGEWADVLALLPAPPPKETRNSQSCRLALQLLLQKVQHPQLEDRVTYGNPIHLQGFRHEPTNEQGVILLFGMLAKDLGYMIESAQTGFPDCEAKRRVGAGQWQRVRIEFEFESKNFRDHGHPPDGCDLIVCWRHNWPACPTHLEILELSSLIKGCKCSAVL